MIEVRPYQYKDALELEPKEEGIKNQEGYENWAKINEMGPGYTIVVNNDIVACAGIRIFWEGSGEAWAILSKTKANKHIKLILKEFGKRLEFFIKELKLRWIQVSLNKNNEKGIRFVQHFGFKKKCTQNGYLPDGSDAFLFAREIKL